MNAAVMSRTPHAKPAHSTAHIAFGFFSKGTSVAASQHTPASLHHRLHFSDYRGGLNGWTQHWLEVYSLESESLRFFSGVDLSAAPLCPDATGYSRTGLFSSGSI